VSLPTLRPAFKTLRLHFSWAVHSSAVRLLPPSQLGKPLGGRNHARSWRLGSWQTRRGRLHAGDDVPSRARRTDCLFQADNSGGHRQSNWLWWYALGCTFAEEHSNVFLYEPGGVVGSQNHACFEAQRCIRKRLYDHTGSMNSEHELLLLIATGDADPHPFANARCFIWEFNLHVISALVARCQARVGTHGLASSLMAAGKPAVGSRPAVLLERLVLLVPPKAVGFHRGTIRLGSRFVLSLKVEWPAALPVVHRHIDGAKRLLNVIDPSFVSVRHLQSRSYTSIRPSRCTRNPCLASRLLGADSSEEDGSGLQNGFQTLAQEVGVSVPKLDVVLVMLGPT